MANPETGEEYEGEILYHATCPWSVACRQCLIQVRDGEEFICPFDKARRVRASKRVTEYGTPYTLVQCCIVMEEDE